MTRVELWRGVLRGPAAISPRISSGFCVCYGAWLLGPMNTYASSPTFAVLESWVPEGIVGSIFLLVGLLGGFGIVIDSLTRARGWAHGWDHVLGISLISQGCVLLLYAVLLGNANFASGFFWIYGWLGLGDYVAYWSLRKDAS